MLKKRIAFLLVLTLALPAAACSHGSDAGDVTQARKGRTTAAERRRKPY